MAEQGWIKLHRCIRSSWVWNDKPFNRGSAWMDLIMMVNHEDKKIIFNGNLTEVKRGSCITSIRKLGERWGWSNKKIKLFLDQLKLDEMITYESNTKRTLVTIENYSLYQSKETPKIQQSTTEETLKHNKSITEAYQKHTNKNDKELIKNDKEQQERKEGDLLLLYETLGFGTINSIAAGDIELLEKEYTETWVQEAFKEANSNGIRTMNYVKGILKNWKTNGFKAERPKQNYGKKEPGTGFNNFEARSYDYDSLEKKLLGWED